MLRLLNSQYYLYNNTINTIVQAAMGKTTIKYMNKKTLDKLSNCILSSL